MFECVRISHGMSEQVGKAQARTSLEGGEEKAGQVRKGQDKSEKVMTGQDKTNVGHKGLFWF